MEVTSFCAQISPRMRAAMAVCLTLLICSASPLFAQNPSYSSFGQTTTNLVLNGNAQIVSPVLRLNPAQTGQVGSAWYSLLQPVAEGFSTSFSFKISNPSTPSADGIAFVIQNSQAGTQALGQGGGFLGYTGIENSLAIEFDTYANSWDPEFDGSGLLPANHVAIQSCGPNPNTADHTATYNVGESFVPCEIALATAPVNLADGKAHQVRIDYTLPPIACELCSPQLQVTIDGFAVFDGSVSVNLSTLLNLANPTDQVADSAYVGFTGATGSFWENDDILSWTFTPYASQTITQPAPANTTTTFNFGSYLYKVTPNQSIDALSVTEVPTDFASFNPGPNFPGAQCIIYDSTGGKCIEFHAVCNSPSNNACSNVSYDVVTSYDVPAGSPPITNPGFLKATGQDCTAPTFDSNIITQFFQTRTDPTTKGSSKPTFSCFVAVQNVTYAPTDLDILNLASIKVKPNANLTYVSTAANFGPSGAQGVAISNTIPSGTTYVNSALCTLATGCSTASCSFNGTVASCQVGNLDKYGIEFMVTTVKVTAPAGTYITDTATVSAFNPDTDKVPDRSSTTKTLVTSRY